MKKGHYLVRPTSKESRVDLVDFLEKHGFTYRHSATRESTVDSLYPLIIDVIPKTVDHITRAAFAAAAVSHLISEDEFYKEFDSDPLNSVVWRKLLSDDNTFLYEGYTLKGKPYGSGTTYYSNGNKYQEGRFDIKGLVQGREYYPNGMVRFEGAFRICRGYGPNYPVYGDYYDESGKLVYSGEFKIWRSSVGLPVVVIPESYGSVVQHDRPHIDYVMSWEI